MTAHLDRELVLAVICEICKERTPAFSDDRKPFFGYGLDSLDISKIFLARERHPGVAFNETEFEHLQD